MSKGIVYVMSCTQGLLKIGSTQTDQFENRMTRLEQDGYKQFNGFHREFAVEVDDYQQKEDLMHRLFDKSQVKLSGKGIEMFATDLGLVIELMKAFGGKQVYPSTAAEKKPTAVPKRKSPAKALTFAMINVPVGTVLTYTDDTTRKVVTADDKNHITWKGKQYTLSGLASIWHNGQACQGGNYFTYNGKKLTEIRAELEKGDV